MRVAPRCCSRMQSGRREASDKNRRVRGEYGCGWSSWDDSVPLLAHTYIAWRGTSLRVFSSTGRPRNQPTPSHPPGPGPNQHTLLPLFHPSITHPHPDQMPRRPAASACSPPPHLHLFSPLWRTRRVLAPHSQSRPKTKMEGRTAFVVVSSSFGPCESA